MSHITDPLNEIEARHMRAAIARRSKAERELQAADAQIAALIAILADSHGLPPISTPYKVTADGSALVGTTTEGTSQK